MIKIQIKNQFITLPEGTSFPMTFSLAPLQDISKRNNSYSKTVTIPGDAIVNDIFGNLFDVNSDFSFFNPNLRTPVGVFVNDIPIPQLTSLQLLNINKYPKTLDTDEYVEYEVVLTSPLTDFLSTFGEKQLSDIDFSKFDHVLNRENIEASWSNTWDKCYTYPLYYNYNWRDWGYKTETDFYTCIFARKYWEGCFSGSTFSFDFSDEFNSEVMNHLIVPGQTIPILSDATIATLKFRVGTSGGTATVAIDVDSNGHADYSSNEAIVKFDDETTPPNFDTNNIFDPLNYKYVPDKKSASNNFVKCQVSVSATTAPDFYRFTARNKMRTELIFYKNGVKISGGEYYHDSFFSNELTATGAEIEKFNIEFELLNDFYKNDEVYVTLAITFADIVAYDTIAGRIPVTIIAEIKPIVENYWYNEPVKIRVREDEIIYLNEIVKKNIKQKDFLKTIINKFNLFAIPDSSNQNLIHFRTQVEFYKNQSECVDWTSKIDLDQAPEIQLLSELQNKDLYWADVQDNDDGFLKNYFNETNKVYGEKLIILDNQFLIGRQTISASIFSPTPSLTVGTFSAGTYDVVSSDKISTPAISSENPEGNNLKLLFYKPNVNIPNGSTWNFGYVINNGVQLSSTTYSYYPYAGHLNDPYSPTIDLNYDIADYYLGSVSAETVTSGNVYNKYWKNQIEQIIDGKLVTYYIYLNEQDIFELDFSKKIFINNSWFYLNQIIDYNPELQQSTKVELIKCKDAITFVEEKLTPKTIWDDCSKEVKKYEGLMASPKEWSAKFFNTRKNLIGKNVTDCQILGVGNVVQSNSSRNIIQGNYNNIGFGAVDSVIQGGTGNTINGGVSNSSIIAANNYTMTENNTVNIGGNSGVTMNYQGGLTAGTINNSNTVISNNLYVGGGTNLSAITATTIIIMSGGSISAPGMDMEIVYNNSGVLAANPIFKFDYTNGAITLGTRAAGTVGAKSFSVGEDNICGTPYSNIFGHDNYSDGVAIADGNVIFGSYNCVSAATDYCFINGHNNLIKNNTHHDSIFGNDNTISTYSSNSTIFGSNNIISGGTGTTGPGCDWSLIYGEKNLIDTNSDYGIIFGRSNTAVTSSQYSVTFGKFNYFSESPNSFSVGNYNVLNASDNSFILGSATTVTNSSFSSAFGKNHSIFGNYCMIFGGLTNTLLGSYLDCFGETNSIGLSNFSSAKGLTNSITLSNNSNIIGSGNTIESSVFATLNGFDNNISGGTGSFIVGSGNAIAGNYITIFGKANLNDTVNSEYSSMFGEGNYIYGSHSMMVGANNELYGNYSLLGGLNNTMYSQYSLLIGSANYAGGQLNNYVLGSSNSVDANLNFIFGYDNIVASVANNSYCFSVGEGNRNYLNSSDSHQYVFGKDNIAWKNSNIFVFGQDNFSAALNSVILGGHDNTIMAEATGSVILGCSGITATESNTVYACNLTALNNLSGSSIFSGSTNLTDLFQLKGEAAYTRVQNGLNTYTGGTFDFPTVNVSGLTIDNITVSGESSFNSISATTFYSGSTDLSHLFINDCWELGTGSITGVTSVQQRGGFNDASGYASIATNRGNTASGNFSFAGGFNTVASGQNSFNYSETDPLYTGAGAQAINSAILGGYNNEILSSAERSVVLGGINIVATESDTVYSTNLISSLNISATTLYSGSTDLSLLFKSISAPSAEGTNIQNGLNTYTGGTSALPTVNVSGLTIDNITVSGNSSFATLSATTFLSGSTDLSTLFQSKLANSNIAYTNSANTFTLAQTLQNLSGTTERFVSTQNGELSAYTQSIDQFITSGTVIGNITNYKNYSGENYYAGSLNGIYAGQEYLSQTADTRYCYDGVIVGRNRLLKTDYIRTTTSGQATATTITMLPNSVMDLEVWVTARQTDDSNRAAYHLEGLFYRGAGNAIQQGATTSISTIESNSAWDCGFGTGTSYVNVIITGATASTIDWYVEYNRRVIN